MVADGEDVETPRNNFRASLSFFWRRHQALMMRHSSFSSLLVFAISACHLVSAVQPTTAWKYKTGRHSPKKLGET
jgi:hypothetical protein